MSKPWKILIIRLSSLGDILHAMPAVQSLRAAFPAAEIDWLVDKEMEFFLSAVPGINDVLTLNAQSFRERPLDLRAWGDFWRLIRRLRAKRYDLCIDFQGLIKSGLLAWLSRAGTRMGFSRDLIRERPAHWFYHQTVRKPSQEVHVARLNEALARAAGGCSTSDQIALRASEDDWRDIESRLREEHLSQYVLINPGGGWPTKNWKPAKYGSLAARIQNELNLNVVVTTGPGEESLYAEICQHCTNPPPRHFAVPFLQLIPLCLKARLFVGGDTGPFHLACVLGTPVVGIFGPTSPVRNGPISEKDEVVVHVLHCSFCYGRTCPTQNECMDITVDEVFGAIVRRLEAGDDRARSGNL